MQKIRFGRDKTFTIIVIYFLCYYFFVSNCILGPCIRPFNNETLTYIHPTKFIVLFGTFEYTSSKFLFIEVFDDVLEHQSKASLGQYA